MIIFTCILRHINIKLLSLLLLYITSFIPSILLLLLLLLLLLTNNGLFRVVSGGGGIAALQVVYNTETSNHKDACRNLVHFHGILLVSGCCTFLETSYLLDKIIILS